MLALLLANGALLLKNKKGQTPINFWVEYKKDSWSNLVYYWKCGDDAKKFLINWQNAQKNS